MKKYKSGNNSFRNYISRKLLCVGFERLFGRVWRHSLLMIPPSQLKYENLTMNIEDELGEIVMKEAKINYGRIAKCNYNKNFNYRAAAVVVHYFKTTSLFRL